MRRTFLTVAIALALSACGGSTEGLMGQELYDRSCGSCHLADGAGLAGPAVGPGSNSVNLTDDQLAAVIRVGPGTMPAFSRFSDEQVDSLVAYLRELQGQ